MTALRLTPISAAISLQLRPVAMWVLSCSIRSGVQVAVVMSGLVAPRPVLGRRGGEDRAQRLRPTAHDTAITESHPHAAAATRCLMARSDFGPGQFKLVERKPSSRSNVPRFDSPANS
jgi:hypothetical protein